MITANTKRLFEWVKKRPEKDVLISKELLLQIYSELKEKEKREYKQWECRNDEYKKDLYAIYLAVQKAQKNRK